PSAPRGSCAVFPRPGAYGAYRAGLAAFDPRCDSISDLTDMRCRCTQLDRSIPCPQAWVDAEDRNNHATAMKEVPAARNDFRVCQVGVSYAASITSRGRPNRSRLCLITAPRVPRLWYAFGSTKTR